MFNVQLVPLFLTFFFSLKFAVRLTFENGLLFRACQYHFVLFIFFFFIFYISHKYMEYFVHRNRHLSLSVFNVINFLMYFKCFVSIADADIRFAHRQFLWTRNVYIHLWKSKLLQPIAINIWKEKKTQNSTPISNTTYDIRHTYQTICRQ